MRTTSRVLSTIFVVIYAVAVPLLLAGIVAIFVLAQRVGPLPELWFSGVSCVLLSIVCAWRLRIQLKARAAAETEAVEAQAREEEAQGEAVVEPAEPDATLPISPRERGETDREAGRGGPV